MKLLLLAFAVASSAAPVGAAEPSPGSSQPLQLRPKVLVAAPLAHNSAPFVSPASEPQLDLAPRELGRELRPSSCASAHTVCYDPAAGHIVFKPARQLMPEIPGLQRENISVRRDRITFRYSF